MSVLLALVFVGCGSSDDDATDAGLFCEVSSHGFDSYVGAVDVLFVIDTTPEMQAHAAGLAFNMPRFANVLQNIEGGMPGLHIGFVTADGGALVAMPGSDACTAPQGRYLIDEVEPWFRCSDQAGTRCSLNNYDGALDEVLPCLAPAAGDTADSREPLAAALRALDGSILDNAGFDRRDTPLQIVIIAADDDASPMPVQSYADAIRALSDDGVGPIVSVVAPADSPRLQAFADAFPQRSTTVDIAEEDWVGALVLLAELFRRVTGFPCLNGADMTDLDSTNVGLQPDCAVTSTAGDLVIPACEMLTADRPHPETPLPCWWIRDWGDVNGPDCRYNVQIEHDGFPTVLNAEVRCSGTCE